MNLPIFLSWRTAFETKSFSGFISKIALTAIALSVCIMIIGSAVTQGYQHEISAKFYDCWGHIHVTTFIPDPGNMLSDEKIQYNKNLVQQFYSNPAVKSVKTYAIRSAIIKAENEMEGIVLKGVHPSEGLGAIDQYICEGKMIDSMSGSDKILVSKVLADKMNLKIGAKVLIYVVDKNDFQPRARRVYVSGIYATGLEDFDKLFVVCHAQLIHEMNHEDATSIQGYEISLYNEAKMAQTVLTLQNQVSTPLHVYSIRERFPGVFSWLGMMQTNEGIIIIIMMIIAFINMCTGLLILILERTTMIGVLKSLGMANNYIGRIFIYSGAYIIIAGAGIGSLLAFTLCFIQKQFHLIHLDESTYFIQYIPIHFNWLHIGGILFTSILFCTGIMIVPSLLVRKINVVKALRFQ